ncbi:hypothetical protein LTR56_002593 [Elasticomyces elasticus]|nr:hypothetical protein LTR22_013495 [Elasticomyces elasticus]KAK3657079.1 hypothetical protein LTR56_002593 [Elasticomyces elasticus]KAK5762357.1 hypothetical protein LTS12_007516 [Elasticomyces elasticus]
MATQPEHSVATPCDQSTTFISNLFRLPAELRLQIYSTLLFTKPSPIDLRSETGPMRIDGNTILPPVMRIAKSIREDAIGLYLKHLREIQIVLAARQMDYRRCLESTRADALMMRWMNAYRRDNNREWVARVDKLVAEVGGGTWMSKRY